MRYTVSSTNSSTRFRYTCTFSCLKLHSTHQWSDVHAGGGQVSVSIAPTTDGVCMQVVLVGRLLLDQVRVMQV